MTDAGSIPEVDAAFVRRLRDHYNQSNRKIAAAVGVTVRGVQLWLSGGNAIAPHSQDRLRRFEMALSIQQDPPPVRCPYMDAHRTEQTEPPPLWQALRHMDTCRTCTARAYAGMLSPRKRRTLSEAHA